MSRFGGASLTPFGIVRRELVLKEMRLFFRDTTQWSQLILLAVLVIVYVFNIKFLPLRGEGMTFFLANVVPFLNLVLAGFVLASIAARFIFPGVSLEGRTLWLLRSSPMSMRRAALVEVLGRDASAARARARDRRRDRLLAPGDAVHDGRVDLHDHAHDAGASRAWRIGFGTLFPQFETENAAQIPTSFGGLVFMMSSVALIGAVVMLEARPVYTYLSARRRSGRGPTRSEMVRRVRPGGGRSAEWPRWSPSRLALRRLEELERVVGDQLMRSV